MEYIIGIIVGVLFTYVLFKKPIEITVHHTYENVVSPENMINMEEIEEKMLKDDPKNDTLYSEFDKFLEQSREIMGGSDR